LRTKNGLGYSRFGESPLQEKRVMGIILSDEDYVDSAHKPQIFITSGFLVNRVITPVAFSRTTYDIDRHEWRRQALAKC